MVIKLLLILLSPILCFAQWGVWSQWSNTGGEDNMPPYPPTTITADTNGIGSCDLLLAGFDPTTDSTFAYATLTPDATPSKDSLAGAIADTSLIDSLLTWNFPHGLTNEGNVYLYIGVQDDSGNVKWNSTSIIIPDMWSPAAGTIAYFNFVPPYNDSLSIDSSLTADAVNLIISVRKSANDSWTVLGYHGNVDIDSSYSLTSLISYVGSDTHFVKAEWVDDADNLSIAILDTILPTGTPSLYYFLGTYDSTHTVLSSALIGVGSTETSFNWDMKINFVDTVLGLTGDTLAFDIPDTLFTQHPDTTYLKSIIIFTTGQSPDTSDLATYPER